MIKANVRVNGNNIDEVTGEDGKHTKYVSAFAPFTHLKRDKSPETEPFDESLDVSIHGMADERYTWDKTLATHRRNGPRRLEQVMIKLIELQRFSTSSAPEEDGTAPERNGGQERK